MYEKIYVKIKYLILNILIYLSIAIYYLIFFLANYQFLSLKHYRNIINELLIIYKYKSGILKKIHKLF